MMNFLNNKSRFGSLFLIMFAIIYLRYVYDIPLDTTFSDSSISARTLPKNLAIIMIIMSLIQLFIGDDETSISDSVKGYQWRKTIYLCLLMLLYSLTFSFLGFAIATFFFLVSGFYILGEKNWKISIGVAGSLSIGFWALLTYVLNLYLDNGEIIRLMVGLFK